MKQFLLLFTLISSLLYSCSDNDETFNIDLNKTYVSSRIETGEIRMFTSQGEVKDLSSIEYINKRYQLIKRKSFEFLINDELIENNPTTTISFDKLNHSTIHSNFNNSSIEYNFESSGNLLRFISQDTSSYVYRESSLFNFIGKYEALYKEIKAFPGTSGYVDIAITLEEKYAKITQEKLLYPKIKLFFYQYDSMFGAISSVSGSINNELNENISEHLSESDTLLLQVNWITFE